MGCIGGLGCVGVCGGLGGVGVCWRPEGIWGGLWVYRARILWGGVRKGAGGGEGGGRVGQRGSRS